jgi:hypothetical protein
MAAPLPAPLAPAPLLAPRKKHTNNVPVILGVLGAGALVLVALAAIGFLAVGKLGSTLVSSGFKSGVSTPQAMPVTLSGSYQAASNARECEQLLQRLLSGLQGFNGVLSQVVDSESARRQADQVQTKYNELMTLSAELTAFKPRMTAEEDRRLEATYKPPVMSAVDQLRGHALRIRQIQSADLAFGGRFSLDDLPNRMGALQGPGFRFGPNSNLASFQPATPPSFRPPQASMGRPPMTRPPMARPPINRPPQIGPRVPMAGPRHPPINHGMTGPGAMHGPGAMRGRHGR